MGRLRIGTAGWSYRDWVGPFYREGTTPAAMLDQYVGCFGCVELDSSFYGIPRSTAVDSWRRRVPLGFEICPKAPQTITHERLLLDCEEEAQRFVRAVGGLGPALGPIVLQFPYFRKRTRLAVEEFADRLAGFLDLLRRFLEPERRIAVEVRNRTYWKPPLLEVLREHHAALVVADHPYLPDPEEVLARDDLVTADFCYLRLLGDRYRIEEITKSWNRIVTDKGWRLRGWAEWIRVNLPDRDVYAFANNHYEGYAPETVRRLQAFVEDRDKPEARGCR